MSKTTLSMSKLQNVRPVPKITRLSDNNTSINVSDIYEEESYCENNYASKEMMSSHIGILTYLLKENDMLKQRVCEIEKKLDSLLHKLDQPKKYISEARQQLMDLISE